MTPERRLEVRVPYRFVERIVERNIFRAASLEDFELSPPLDRGKIDFRKMTPYCFSARTGEVHFVNSSESYIHDHPFVYIPQYRNAEYV
jgi:hypothetical protein